ncbi:MAG: DUF2314 domain-containing protein [Gammaproteobacteria bacterium]|nr:DUF2314 domain-containing protein [Gammaproteobacteria bacterium]
MKFGFIITLLILSFISTSVSARDENEIMNVHETDNEMNNAMLTANNSLPTFIDRFKKPQEGDSNFALKVMVLDEYGVEHFWVTDITITKNEYQGYISNEPRTVKAVTNGQKVTFDSDIVTDWSYDHKGIKQGAFTLKVLIKNMPKEQADYYKKVVGWL